MKKYVSGLLIAMLLCNVVMPNFIVKAEEVDSVDVSTEEEILDISTEELEDIVIDDEIETTIEEITEETTSEPTKEIAEEVGEDSDVVGLQSGDYTYTEFLDRVTITGYTGSSTSITIPSKIDGKIVVNIDFAAFRNCTSLTTVTIPNGVINIRNSAFYGCTSLKKIIIPNSVRTIQDHVFGGCTSLTDVIIPNGVTWIGDYAFSNCKSIEIMTIPNSVTSIGNSAFSNCTSLTTLNMSNSVTSIGNSVFFNCIKLTSITIPDSVTSIGNYAFYLCESLTSVTIPNSVKSIGEYAFGSCQGLTTINIPKGITEIKKSTFKSCTSLTSITIPNSVTSIDDYAFFLCTGLTSITIPNSVTSIGDLAFDGCRSLTKVTIPNSVTSIGNSAFDGCRNLTKATIPSSVISIGDEAFYNTASDFVIYCNKGSYVGKYAKANKLNYKYSVAVCTVTLSKTIYIYSNTAKCPIVTVMDGSTILTRGTDYTVVYANNINLGTATVTITGKGDYTGTIKKSYYITKSISEMKASLSATEYIYDGTEKKPTVTVKDGSTTLTKGTDYTVAYTNNINAGTATATITGKGIYSGTITKTYTIKKSIGKVKVSLSATEYIYDGLEKKPKIVLKDDTKILEEGTDYTVEYFNNKSVGKATVTVTGKGYYIESVTKTFTIKKSDYYSINKYGGEWNGKYYYLGGLKMTNIFFFDGEYTYYLQADGTPMKNKLTYHPDGVHLIYFDDKGHELFDKFQYCSSVGYTCYFDSSGYLYKDVITFRNGKAYYLDGNGKMKQNEYFKFDKGGDLGHATADGSLENSGFSYDQYGRVVFYHWNGMVARGLITDGTWYYNMDTTDGHLIGQFAAN